MEEKTTKNWWMIGFLILLGIIIGFVINSQLVSSADWILNKSSTCNLPEINLTGIDCERFWCNNVSSGNYSDTKEVCFIYSNISITNTTNITMNWTGLNETWIRDITRNETYIILNGSEFVNRTEVIFVKNGIMTYFENVTEEKVLLYLEEHGQTTTPREPFPVWGIITIVLVLGIVVCVVVIFKPKNKDEDIEDDGYIPGYKPRKPYKTGILNGKPTKEDIKEFERTGNPPENTGEDKQ